MRSLLLSVLLAISVVIRCGAVAAQEASLAPLDQFALDGLDMGTSVMNQPIDNIIRRFGLPERIEIHHELAGWDIDLEETPAEWIYPGFTIMTLYLRDGLAVQGVRNLVPGPYRDDRKVVGLRVFDPCVRVRFGLGVGTSVQEVLTKLGTPVVYGPDVVELGYGEYREGMQSRTRVEVTFRLDRPGGNVREIAWKRETWH